jgi:prepilin-type N-terminal cleavage/methylation domain-containing protein
MKPNLCLFRGRGPTHEQRGFTLIELLVSLAVISVGITLVVRVFLMSNDLGLMSQHREMAATIAEDQLSRIMTVPSSHVWDHTHPDDSGFFRVKRSEDDPRAGVSVPLPDVLLPDQQSYDHQKKVYEKFRWAAFARLPGQDEAHFEVFVSVYWVQDGEAESVALSGAVPRSSVDPDWAGN